jgi:DNA-binding GntR family transcriptional regulator
VSKSQSILERPPLLVDLIIQKLRSNIITNQLTPGTRLTEEKLAADLKISRTPLREALIRMEYLGYIKRGSVRGWEVASLKMEKVLGQYELKTIIEVNAVLLSSEKSRVNTVKDLRKVLKKMKAAVEADDHDLYRRLDFDFHKVLVKHHNNSYMNEVYLTLMDFIEWMRNLSIYPALQMDESFRNHTAIAQALEDGDMKHAGEMLFTHLNIALQKIKDNLHLDTYENLEDIKALFRP